ncbi:MAG: head maturation protease, ClpP-related [Thermoguttaceae bacterium]|jgi:ATP-dependent Clp endopeptidase proteolytic subunit ClpP
MNASHFRCQAGSAELYLFDIIDQWGYSAKQLVTDLKTAGDVKSIDVHINSPGGAITEGLALYNILKRHPAPKRVTIDGLAASIASVVAMAGDEIDCPANAYMMIHNPGGVGVGESDDLRHTAELLDKMKAGIVGIYAERTGQTPEAISALMDAETWMTGQEALELGFCDKCTDEIQMAAVAGSDRLRIFSRVPAALLGQPARHPTPKPQPPISRISMTELNAAATAAAATYQELVAALPGADCEFLCKQLAGAATLPAAQSAWMLEQSKRLQAAREQLSQLRDSQSKAKPGVPLLGNGGGTPSGQSDGDPIVAWNEALAVELKRHNGNRQKALSACVAANPELHKSYVVAYNAAAGKEVVVRNGRFRVA